MAPETIDDVAHGYDTRDDSEVIPERVRDALKGERRDAIDVTDPAPSNNLDQPGALEKEIEFRSAQLGVDPDSPEALAAARHGAEVVENPDEPRHQVILRATKRELEAREEVERASHWQELVAFKEKLDAAARDVAEKRDEFEEINGSLSPKAKEHFRNLTADMIASQWRKFARKAEEIRQEFQFDGPRDRDLTPEQTSRVRLELQKIQPHGHQALRDKIETAAANDDKTLLPHLMDELRERVRAETGSPDAVDELRQSDPEQRALIEAHELGSMALTDPRAVAEDLAMDKLERITQQMEMVRRVVAQNGAWTGPRARLTPRATPDLPIVGEEEMKAHGGDA